MQYLLFAISISFSPVFLFTSFLPLATLVIFEPGDALSVGPMPLLPPPPTPLPLLPKLRGIAFPLVLLPLEVPFFLAALAAAAASAASTEGGLRPAASSASSKSEAYTLTLNGRI